jgi:hypothetical protein
VVQIPGNRPLAPFWPQRRRRVAGVCIVTWITFACGKLGYGYGVRGRHPVLSVPVCLPARSRHQPTSRRAGSFSPQRTEHDIAFLQGIANVLGMAVERQRQERALNPALEHQQVLMKEINNRVKNSRGNVPAPNGR